MNDSTNLNACGRAEDLISFLYGELGEREARSFEQHCRECPACEAELAGLGFVRQSMIAWRDQSLGVLPVASFTDHTRQEQRRSALAAIRGFFGMSPLWMKAATAFAVVLFCVLAGLSFIRLRETPRTETPVAKVYTEKEFAEAVKKEVDTRVAQLNIDRKESPAIANDQNSGSHGIKRDKSVRFQRELTGSNQGPHKLRKPLSRAERDQLAADLRLISDDDQDALQLLGDRINHEQ